MLISQTWKRPLIVLVLIVLLLSACGGGEEAPEVLDQPDESPTEVSEEPEPTDVPPTATPIPTPSPVPTLTATQHLEEGLDFWDDGQLEDALVSLETAVSLEPENAEALSNLGGIYVTFQEYDKALEVLNRAYEIDETNGNTQVNLCTVLALLEDEGAQDRCDVAALLEPDNHNVPNAMGIIALTQGRLEDAIPLFERSIELGNDDGFAHNNLGYTYMQLERLPEAIVQLEEAVVVNPENSQAQYNLGLARARDGQLEAAIEAYDATINIDPNYASAYFDKAIILTQLDNAIDAIENFETYLALRPDDAAREDILAEITRLQGFAFVELAEASPGTLDFTNPASVVQAIFYAAANESYDLLPTLCDPDQQNDGDTMLVCEVHAEHERVDEFLLIFPNGVINGPVTISGDIAEIPFLFGENADVALTMKLVLRDGKWYLFEF